MEIPVGSKFTPLHARCPECGVDLSKQPEQPESNTECTENNEYDASSRVGSGMASNDSSRIERGLLHKLRLKWMVNPFTKTNEKYTK